jgi:hypothetical protein
MLHLLSAGAALLGCGLPAATPTRDDEAELAAWLRAKLGDAEVTALAAAWRARHPDETEPQALARALLAGRARGEPLAAHLARTNAAEHAGERAELVDGWVLAPTEARLVTLLSALS